jgi:molecular chaperone GrpE (heat shock protein)
MNEGITDDQLLDQFRNWLNQTRQEAAAAGWEPAPTAEPGPSIGLDRLVEEFTALRHETKLQTRSSRSLEERLEAALTSLDQAVTAFRSPPAKTDSAGATLKSLVSALADLDEALERGRDQWARSGAKLVGESIGVTQQRLDEAFEGLSWWQRRFASVYHRKVREQLELLEESRKSRESLFSALLSGSDMIRQRLARTMASVGLLRIPTVGRVLDPELMVVIEVVDADGPAGQIIEEIRRGYTWNGALLRAAEVRAIRPRFESDTPGQPVTEE